MYEHRRKTPLTHAQFRARVLQHAFWTLLIVSTSLTIGVLGYHFLGELTWIDSLLNASMILGGMGPVSELRSDAAKVFASLYALFSGVVFIGAAGLLIAPFAHRLLHHFHWEDEDAK